MAEELFTKIVTRALADRAFRDGLVSNPQRTLSSAGFAVTAEQLSLIALARPAEWGSLALDDIVDRIDILAGKR